MRKTLERYLGRCAKRTIARDKPKILAIGGSVGKTSTRYALTLSMNHEPHSGLFRASQKNYNNELGLPLSVFACDMPGRNPLKWLTALWVATTYALGWKRLKFRWLILEMGADHPGDLAYLVDIAPPTIAVMTSMGAEHVEYFGTEEAAIEEERTLLRALTVDGEALLNVDDPATWASRSVTKAEVLGFGKSEEAAVRIRSVQVAYDPAYPDASGLDVEFEILRNHNKKIRLHGIYGESHAYAVAAALTYLLSLDHGLEMAMDLYQKFYRGMPGRARLVPGIKNTILLDDSYNAQPQAMAAAVRDLAKFPVPVGGRRIAALGDMRELGPLTQGEHEKIGRLVAESNLDVLVTCGQSGKIIGQSAVSAGMPAERLHAFETSPEAGLFLQQEIIKPGDAILIKGSQGIRMEKITKELMAEPLKAPELLVRQGAEWQGR